VGRRAAGCLALLDRSQQAGARRGGKALAAAACLPAARRVEGRCFGGRARRARLPRPVLAPRRDVHACAGDPRSLPGGAVRALHRRRRTAVPGRAQPSAMVAAQGRRRCRVGDHGAAPDRRRAVRAVRRLAGPARLATGGVVSAQRRTALMSVGAAASLVVLKLVVGLSANSLGLVSEAVHSGTDLVAALLTFFALGVAGRPADVSHQYGHGKAEHLAALAEATFLGVASVVIGIRAIERLTASTNPTVHVTWYVLATVLVVIAVDASRAGVSWRI